MHKNSIEAMDKYIFVIRGENVMLDVDIAQLYGIETRILIQAINRNLERFPADFMFQLTKDEFINLRSQFVISSWGGRRYLPYVFTEHGIAMLSSVLKSSRAIKVNIEIMRAFVRFRRFLVDNKELQQKLKKLESKYDAQFKVIFEAIHQLMIPSESIKQRRIGFRPWDEKHDKKKSI